MGLSLAAGSCCPLAARPMSGGGERAQRPARPDIDRTGLWQCRAGPHQRLQAKRAGKRNHRAVVGAKRGLGAMHPQSMAQRRIGQSLAQAPIGTHATGDDKRAQSGLAKSGQ